MGRMACRAEPEYVDPAASRSLAAVNSRTHRAQAMAASVNERQCSECLALGRKAVLRSDWRECLKMGRLPTGCFDLVTYQLKRQQLGGKRTFSLYSCMMEHEGFDPVPMLKYVSAFFAVKVFAAGAILLYALNFESEPPISSIIITMIAVWVPILWFAKIVNRPMLGSERLWFAVGNTVAEFVFTIAWVLSMFWLTGASFSWEGLSQVLGVGGDPEAAKVGLVAAMTLGWLPVPIFSAFFGWLMTKNLPKEILR